MVIIDGSIFIRTTSCFRLGGGGGGQEAKCREALETVCDVREVERCEEVLEEKCSLVEEVVPECREVERQECRLKEQECSSVEREQCWLGPVGREVSLI